MAKDIYDNIDDVKCSLDNAQRSFRKNNGLRGELDLMMAEASIRYLREKRGFVSVWNRQKLAAALAVLLVLAGYGGWWYAGVAHEEHSGVQAAQTAAVQQKGAGVTPAAAEPQQTVIPGRETADNGREPAGSNIQQTQQSRGSTNYLAETDMQQLVRTGRQVLQDAD